MKKIISMLLALMLICTFCTPAFAAADITVKPGKTYARTVDVGDGFSLTVSDIAAEFYSDNEDAASVDKTSGFVSALAPGKAVIFAKNAETGEVIATATVTVVLRADRIITDPVLYLGKAGDTATIEATLEPADSSDALTFVSSDKTVATVGKNSGKVTAANEGRCTITVYAKETKATSDSNKNNKIAAVEVYVGPVLDSVVQTASNQLEATFKSNSETIGPDDLTVEELSTGLIYVIKSVGISTEDSTKSVITLYSDIGVGQSCVVRYRDYEAKFTATAAENDISRIGSVLSEGSVQIIIATAVLAIGGVAALFIAKRKKPVPSDSAGTEEDE